jgi:hypothetical protein
MRHWKIFSLSVLVVLGTVVFQAKAQSDRHTTIPSVKTDEIINSTTKLSGYYSATQTLSPQNNGFPQPFSTLQAENYLAQTIRLNPGRDPHAYFVTAFRRRATAHVVSAERTHLQPGHRRLVSGRRSISGAKFPLFIGHVQHTRRGLERRRLPDEHEYRIFLSTRRRNTTSSRRLTLRRLG